MKFYTAIMTTTLAPPVGFQVDNQPLVAEGRFWRISRERYHKMIRAGLFDEDDDYELIHGYLLKKMAKNRAHIWVVRLLMAYFTKLLIDNESWFTTREDPIGLLESEPEPDVLIVRGKMTDFWNLPEPEDIGIAIEVSDSTLATDRSVKKPLYAAEGIEQYWIVDVNGRQIEVYTDPVREDYARKVVYGEDEAIEIVLDGVNFGRLLPTSILPPLS